MQVPSYGVERHSQRISATIPISLLMQPEDTKTMHDAWMVDISATGARVRSSLVLAAGQTVGIIPSGDSGQAIPYRVVWVEQWSSGCIAGLALMEAAQA
jgi:hypothetical protein